MTYGVLKVGDQLVEWNTIKNFALRKSSELHKLPAFHAVDATHPGNITKDIFRYSVDTFCVGAMMTGLATLTDATIGGHVYLWNVERVNAKTMCN